jgi:hypothetical protein
VWAQFTDTSAMDEEAVNLSPMWMPKYSFLVRLEQEGSKMNLSLSMFLSVSAHETAKDVILIKSVIRDFH